MRGESQAGQRRATGAVAPQWWQRSDWLDEWKTSGRWHSGQIWTYPQSRQTTTVAAPRRLIRRIARSPAFVSARRSRQPDDAREGPDCPTLSSSRRSTTSTVGRVPATRSAIAKCSYSPVARLAQADAHPEWHSPAQRGPARSDPAQRLRRAPGSAASSPTCTTGRAPRRRSRRRCWRAGARTAMRVPTTTLASPAANSPPLVRTLTFR